MYKENAINMYDLCSKMYDLFQINEENRINHTLDLSISPIKQELPVFPSAQC